MAALGASVFLNFHMFKFDPMAVSEEVLPAGGLFLVRFSQRVRFFFFPRAAPPMQVGGRKCRDDEEACAILQFIICSTRLCSLRWQNSGNFPANDGVGLPRSEA